MLIPLGFLKANAYVPTGLYWYQGTGLASTTPNGNGVDVASDGSILVAGDYYDAGISGSQGYTLKTTSAGSVSLARAIRATFQDVNSSIAIDSLDGIYSVGVTSDSSSTTNNNIITKHELDGTRSWVRTIGGTTNMQYYSRPKVAVDPSDGIYIAGNINTSTTNAATVFLLMKWSTTGTLTWQRRLAQSSTYIWANCVTADVNGVIVGGNGNTIAKYNLSGTLQWQKSWPISTDGVYQGVALDSSSNIYAVGTLTSPARSSFLVKFNSSGTVQWQKSIVAGYEIVLNEVTVSGTSVYATGTINDTSGGTNSNIFIMKFDDAGTLQWARKLGRDSIQEEGLGIVIASNGDVIVTGNANNHGVALARLPNDGSLTGNYAIDTGGILKYAAATITVNNLSDTAGNATRTASTPSYSTTTPTVTATTPSSSVLGRAEI